MAAVPALLSSPAWCAGAAGAEPTLALNPGPPPCLAVAGAPARAGPGIGQWQWEGWEPAALCALGCAGWVGGTPRAARWAQPSRPSSAWCSPQVILCLLLLWELLRPVGDMAFSCREGQKSCPFIPVNTVGMVRWSNRAEAQKQSGMQSTMTPLFFNFLFPQGSTCLLKC